MQKIIDAIEKMNLEINNNQVEKFLLYMNLLYDWNKKINLTSITDENEIIIKHFADSVSLLSVMQIKNSNVIDIGSGAGFPGIPLKILRPQINLTLVDSLGKRVKFLCTVKNDLNLENVNCFHARAEEFVKNSREAYDICVSRAVANLSVLTEICLPFVKVGGYFIAYKGPQVDDEILHAQNCIKKLGGEITDIKKICLPFSDIIHSLIFVRKLSNSPLKYPRNYAKILKTPL